VANKLDRLKQDLVEVRGVIQDLEPYESYLDSKYKELKDKFEILEEHLKDHIETMENYISDIN